MVGEVRDLEPREYLHDVADIYHIEVGRQVAPAIPVAEITVAELAAATSNDAVLCRLVPFVRDGRMPTKNEAKALGADGARYVDQFESLQLDHGVLYLVNNHQDGTKVSSTRRICLPLEFRDRLF